MGALGSKEDLGQIAVIYGYNYCDFDWRISDNRSVYHTTGLIIQNNGKKYVLTTRMKMIGCKNIVMYYCYHDKQNIIMRNDLHILFQLIEYDLIILGTIDKSELDLSMSTIISGDYSPKLILPSHSTDSQIVIPKKKSIYHVVRIDTDIYSDSVNYHVHLSDVKFIQSIIYDESYLPRNFLYQFKLVNDSDDTMLGICGGIIFNKKHDLMGIIYKAENNILLAMPSKMIYNAIRHFSVSQEFTHLTGLLSCPINCEIDPNKKIVIVTTQTLINTPDHKKRIKKNDEIISIDGKNIFIDDEEILVFDSDYKQNIPIDIYLMLNLIHNMPMELIIKRNTAIRNFYFYGESMANYIFPITSQPYWYPSAMIPYINLSSLIIVEFTYELLDILIANQIQPVNDIIVALMEGNEPDCLKNLLVIDCLNETLKNKYNFPRIKIGSKEIITPFLVQEINGKKVKTLNDVSIATEKIVSNRIKFYVSKNNIFTIELE